MSRKQRVAREAQQRAERRRKRVYGGVAAVAALGIAGFTVYDWLHNQRSSDQTSGASALPSQDPLSQQSQMSPLASILPLVPLSPQDPALVYPERISGDMSHDSKTLVQLQPEDLVLERQIRHDAYSFNLYSYHGKINNVSRYVASNPFDYPRFIDDVVAVLEWSLGTVHRTFDCPVKDYTITIMDMWRVETVSVARGGGYIELNLRKWKDRMYGSWSRKEWLYNSAVHEAFHVQNYATDPDEGTFMREFSAMMWEADVALNRVGPGLVFGPGGLQWDKEGIVEDKLQGFDFLHHYNSAYTRGLAWFTVGMIYDQYGQQKVDAVVRELLFDQENWVQSFDHTMARLDVRYKGIPLTMDYTTREFERYLRN